VSKGRKGSKRAGCPCLSQLLSLLLSLNEIQNEVLETVPEGENRVESPDIVYLVDSPDSDKNVGNKSMRRQRLSSSSQRGSDVDCRRKAERTPSPNCSDDNSEQKAGSTSSQNGQSGETSCQSGSDDEKTMKVPVSFLKKNPIIK
jgi:hypothetical protein